MNIKRLLRKKARAVAADTAEARAEAEKQADLAEQQRAIAMSIAQGRALRRYYSLDQVKQILTDLTPADISRLLIRARLYGNRNNARNTPPHTHLGEIKRRLWRRLKCRYAESLTPVERAAVLGCGLTINDEGRICRE